MQSEAFFMCGYVFVDTTKRKKRHKRDTVHIGHLTMTRLKIKQNPTPLIVVILSIELERVPSENPLDTKMICISSDYGKQQKTPAQINAQ